MVAVALSDQVTTCWIDSASDVLTALDRLRDQVSDPDPDADLRASVTAIAASIDDRLTGLMAKVQHQDRVRQMKAAVASMAGAIGTLPSLSPRPKRRCSP